MLRALCVNGMAEKYNTFQVEAAPGIFAGLSLIAGSLYFTLESIYISALGLVSLLVLTYFDKPLKFNLKMNKVFLYSYLLLVNLNIILPIALSLVTANPLIMLMAKISVPVLSIGLGGLIMANHREEKLVELGWKNIENL